MMPRHGLVLEGGAMRGLFTCGIIDVMMEHNLWPDGIVGVSAGAAFGCNYKSRQIGRAIRYNKRYARDSRYSGLRSLLTTGNYFNAQFAYHTVPHQYDIFDYEEFQRNPMEFFVVCTDVETGKPIYKLLDGVTEETYDWIRASASMPIVSRVVELEGHKLLDGGVADSIPLQFFEQQGYDRNIVVLTQPDGYRKEHNKLIPIMRVGLRHYPEMIRALDERHLMYNRQLDYVRQAESEGRCLVIRPEENIPIGHVSHNPEQMQKVYDIGRKTAEKNISEIKRWCTLVVLAACLSTSANAMHSADSVMYRVEMQATTGTGDHNPLWLNANRYGLSSIEKDNGYVRAAATKEVSMDKGRTIDWGAALDIAAAYNFTSTAVIHQAYAEGRWLHGMLTLGSKEQPMQLRNQKLSSGSQTLGINARPVPEVRLSLPEYWDIPLGGRWVSLKGHVAFGKYTDSKWQRDFAHEFCRYTDGALHHSKAGYMRIHKPGSPLTIEGGIEMATQFGGRSISRDSNGNIVSETINRNNLSAFWHALAAGGHEVVETGYLQNVEGNMLGSWLARVTWSEPQWEASLYADHYFEDHSSMFMLEYTGYGQGAQWDTHVKKRFMLYPMKDMMLGVELKIRNNQWLNNIVVEYLYTKYQSGPIYWDHAEGLSEHIGGRDSYYNHGIQAGWQHWGMVIGNPLYRSPVYNTDGSISIENNRFIAWHLGLCGKPLTRLDYRILATIQKGWGTYDQPFNSRRRDLSLMCEANYTLPPRIIKNANIRCAVGIDRGSILGNNLGFQLTLIKRGKL